MKKTIQISIVCMLTLLLFTGCRRNVPAGTDTPTSTPTVMPTTTQPTSRPTTPPATTPTGITTQPTVPSNQNNGQEATNGSFPGETGGNNETTGNNTRRR